MRRSVGRIVVRVFWTIVVLALLAAVSFAYVNRQTFQDHFAAQEFQPSSRVERIASDLNLTDSGKRIFYATHPTIEGRETFSDRCERTDHQGGGHLLGCYTEDRIHLFHVDDDRLIGVVEVTGAHELLHAAYARLSQTEREQLAKRLEATYEDLKGPIPSLEKRMSVYEHLSASRFANELHSVLATEVRDLPEWLEEHYAQWFHDRKTIVDFFDGYSEVFESLQAQAEDLGVRLEELRLSIEAESALYTTAVEQFNADWELFRSRNDAHEFQDDSEEFYRLLAEFEERRLSLDEWRASLESQVSEHESMRVELEALGDLSTELNEKIDSEFSPPVETVQ